MDLDFVLAVISRWIHVGTAIVLVGGTVFQKLVVAPSLPADSADIVSSIRNRWKKFVHIGILLFLVTGFFNYFKAMPAHKGDGLYHALIGTKILLAFGVFFIASALVGRSAGTQKFRDNSPKWTAVIILLSALIVAMSGVVKVRGNSVKPAAESTTPASANAADSNTVTE